MNRVDHLREELKSFGLPAQQLRSIAADRILVLEVPGKRAEALWLDLRQRAAALGHQPVLLGPPEDLERIVENLESLDPSTPDEIIGLARTLDPEAVLTRRLAANVDLDDGEATSDELDDGWEQGEPMASLQATCDHAGKVLGRVALGFVHAVAAWQVPAHVAFGGFNDCPFPAEHVAVHRRWQERFGSVVAAVTPDIVECIVERPPRSRAQALELAREQYAYCGDIVEQGLGSITALAATLLESPRWYFWWD